MKKFIGFALLLLVFCETGFEINLACVLKHTAEVVKVETSLLGEKDQVFVNLSWRWTYQRPVGDAVIVERSIGDSTHFVAVDTISPIDSVMYFNDNDTILNPDGLVYYRLGFLNGKNVEYFDTTDFQIPTVQNFYKPDTEFITVTDDTLRIVFAKLSGLDTTDIAIYKGGPTSIDSLLNFLTNPLFDTTIVDTILKIAKADSLFPVDTLTPYTIKISSSKMAGLDYITDTSIGFRAFIRNQ